MAYLVNFTILNVRTIVILVISLIENGKTLVIADFRH